MANSCDASIVKIYFTASIFIWGTNEKAVLLFRFWFGRSEQFRIIRIYHFLAMMADHVQPLNVSLKKELPTMGAAIGLEIRIGFHWRNNRFSYFFIVFHKGVSITL